MKKSKANVPFAQIESLDFAFNPAFSGMIQMRRKIRDAFRACPRVAEVISPTSHNRNATEEVQR